MDKYEVVKDLGAGNFGVARLLRHKETKELVAMKYIERGHKVRIYTYIFLFFNFSQQFPTIILWLFNVQLTSQIDENVAREIINHRSLRHPNIIRFKEVN